jgi:choline transport protein
MTIVTILVCAAPDFQSSVWVFADTTNSNRSYDKGFLFIFCLLNNTYGFMGTDAGAHLAEEIPSPSINAPKVIVSSPLSMCRCTYIVADNQRYIQ